MTTGTYNVGGTDFLIQPESGYWIARKSLGIDGVGHDMYPSTREYSLTWSLMDEPTFNQLENFYLSCLTGTVVVNLPIYNSPQYVFQMYSGCVLGEPEMSQGYFTDDGYVGGVKMMVRRIQV